MSFQELAIPSMWIFPSEYRQLFDSQFLAMPTGQLSGANGGDIFHNGENAGDGADLIEVTARDLARRALELLGEELGLA